MTDRSNPSYGVDAPAAWSGEPSRRPQPSSAEAARRPQLPAIPERGHYTEQARLSRLQFLRAQTGATLQPLQETRLDATRLTGNLENFIGAVEVPVGLAGPLLFRGQHAEGPIYAPLATSEGALVASATRGATAISCSGGVTTRVVGQRMMRVPVFTLSSLEGAFQFAGWVRGRIEELRAQTRLVSSHAQLVSVEPVILGRMVHVSFTYETGDAAGQNMTTTCTWQASQWILQAVQSQPGIVVEDFMVDGQMSGDKKVTFASFINGRGTRVIAEALIERRVCEKMLKGTPEQLERLFHRTVSAASTTGMVGYNINIANVIAGLFGATGQDLACVHESSVGQLYVEARPEGYYVSLLLPSLVIGTVGGGTHLPAQHALLEMLGCAGPGKVFRLAEIIAGYCLALDLSTMTAMASGEFAAAHEKLGRSRPVRKLERRELDPSFFQPLLRQSLGDPGLVVEAVEPRAQAMGSSIITELTARKVDKLLGLLPLTLRHRRGDGTAAALDVVAKAKPLDAEVMLTATTTAALCNDALGALFVRYKERLGFSGCHARELGIYAQRDPRFLRHAPRVYGLFGDAAREAFVVVMESLGDGVILKDSADDVSGWDDAALAAAIDGIAEVHAVWLGREAELRAQPWLGTPPSAADLVEMAPLWQALATHASGEFPQLVDGAVLARWKRLIAGVGEWAPELERLPRTLVHNDFNPRNLCLRSEAGGLRLCAYDWELATVQVPQHDLAELLCFVLDERATRADVERWLERHRLALQAASGQALDPVAWRRGYRLSLQHLAIDRFAQYLMGHTFRHYGFVERVVRTLWHLVAIEEEVQS